MNPVELKNILCSSFCGGISVNPVASGYAISSAFEDIAGDRISFYLAPEGDLFRIEDDGAYLAHLIAKDIPIDQGQRGQLMDAILSTANAEWDRDTYEIRTDLFPAQDIPRRSIEFLSAMIRVRDLELLTREVVRSTFREDAICAIKKSFEKVANLNEDTPISKDFMDFPADLVIQPLDNYPKAKKGAVYFVNNNDKLNEALLLKLEAENLNKLDFEIIALLESNKLRVIGSQRFQRAQNRDIAMPIFREDEKAAMSLIQRRLALPLSAVA